MKEFWHCLDRFGRLGASRMSWHSALCGEFAKWEPLLRATEVELLIEDPEWPGKILDLDELDDGDFLGLSMEVPSHRPPLVIKRENCVRLVPNLKALAYFLGKHLGFKPIEQPQWSQGAIQEIGFYGGENAQPRAVHLFVPDLTPRDSAIKTAICDAESSILLLPTRAGFTQEVSVLASKFDVRITVLGSARGLEKLSIAPPRQAVSGTRKEPVAPMFTPKEGWEWKDLVLSLERDGLRCAIGGLDRIRPWVDVGIKLRNNRPIPRILKILGDFAAGKRMTQSRSSTNDRKAISDVRKFLRNFVIPLRDNPFREFEDGWGINFSINDTVSRRQIKKMEAEDRFADKSNANSPFDYHDEIDPEEMKGFSIHNY